MAQERERYTHPSYGQIRFARVQGRSRFYGSELEQDHYIVMELHQSDNDRDLTREWYHSLNKVAQVRMTTGQFSELITSMNQEGIPCTIEWLQGNVADLPPVENRKEFVHRKFQDRMKEFANSIRARQIQAKELVKKKTLSKDDMQSLQHHIEWLTTEVENNIPFFAKCFQETMGEVVFEAKLEVENAIQHKINVLGIESLNKLKEIKE